MRKPYNILFVILGIVLAGCQADSIESPMQSDDLLIWDVRLTHQALLMSTQSPYDTISLGIVPRNAKGLPIAHNGTVNFRTSSRDISVDSLGFVRVSKAVNEAWVTADLVEDNIRYKDSVRIRVVDWAPPSAIASMSLSADSDQQPAYVKIITFFQAPSDKAIVARALDVDGEVISGAYFRYWVSDPSSATVDANNGSFRGLIPNRKVWVYGAGTFFGVPVLDSIEISVTEPLFVRVGVTAYYPKGTTTPILKFSPEQIVVGVGGAVSFSRYDSVGYDVNFEDSLSVEAARVSSLPDPVNVGLFGPTPGNIANIISDGLIAARTFPRPGRYRFWSDSLKSEGVIVVK